ncbi:MAG: hypothetical protein CVU96_04660, partial [Firmicutes bacterium HGW-Firmicutes-20]
GGNSAVDTALEIFRKGANVTMVIKKSNLDDGVKYWVRPDIENRIKEGSIKAYYNSEIKEIKLKSADGQSGEKKVKLKINRTSDIPVTNLPAFLPNKKYEIAGKIRTQEKA